MPSSIQPPRRDQRDRDCDRCPANARNLIFVRAAPRRPYREVIRAVDLAKGAGFQIVGYMP